MIDLLRKDDALLVVDAQKDFFPGGALPVPQGDEVIPVINQWLQAAVAKHISIFASRDWHPANHCSFHAQGGPWPVHCVQHSEGAKIHPGIHLPQSAIIINTADDPAHEGYSAFSGHTSEGDSLNTAMKEKGIKRIWVNGLALDYCVCETALDAKKLGYDVHLILEGTRPITPQTGQEGIQRMETAGVIIHRH